MALQEKVVDVLPRPLQRLQGLTSLQLLRRSSLDFDAGVWLPAATSKLTALQKLAISGEIISMYWLG